MPPLLVVIAGPVGAGKTATAQALAKALGEEKPVALVDGDSFWRFIVTQGPGLKHGASAWKHTLRASFAAAASYARNDVTTVYEFTASYSWLRAAAVKHQFHGTVDLRFVVVNPGLETCKRRAAGRAEHRVEEYGEGFLKLYQMYEGVPAQHVIANADGSDAAAVAMTIKKGLEAGAFKLRPASSSASPSPSSASAASSSKAGGAAAAP